MSQPRPRYEPPKRRFQLKISLTEILVCLTIIGLLIAIIFPVLQSTMISNSEEKCMAIAYQRYQATQMYVADYDNTLMPAKHWQDTLTPYVPDKRREQRSCSEVKRFDNNGLGFAMDSRLSGVSLDSIRDDSPQRILFFESTLLARNAHTPGTAFATRHRDMVTKQPHHGYLITLKGNVRHFAQPEGSRITKRGTL
jgi:hypothetical protein